MTPRSAVRLVPILAASVFLVWSSGCRAPVQRVALSVQPSGTSVFVDGEKLASVPAELELRSDRAHVLFFRSEGYRPERVVLEPVERNGRPSLEPGEVQIRLVPEVPKERAVEIGRDDS